MRILEVEVFGRGGLTHYVFNLSRALAARGNTVSLATTVDCEVAAPAAAAGIEVLPVVGRWGTRPPEGESRWRRFVRRFGVLVDAFRVARLAFRQRHDVVHLHCTNQAALLYILLLRFAGRRVVYTAHQVTAHETNRFRDAVFCAIHRLSHLVIAHSEVDRRRLEEECGVGVDRSVVIGHGDYAFFDRIGEGPDRRTARRSLGFDESDQVVLFFGYIRPYKGLDVLLDAWEEVRSRRPRARLLIAGDPVQLGAEARRELVDRADRAGAVHRFEYIPLADVTGYFRCADVVALPYRAISQSGVLFLALSLGVAVVATRVGALPEVLEDRSSALLIRAESRDELASSLVEVLGDDALRRRLVEGGLAVARAHSWTSIAEQTERAMVDVARR